MEERDAVSWYFCYVNKIIFWGVISARDLYVLSVILVVVLLVVFHLVDPFTEIAIKGQY